MSTVADACTVSAWFWGIFIGTSRQQVCIRVRSVFVILFTACNCNLSSWKSSFCNGAVIYFPWNRTICLNSWARTFCAAERVWKCLSFHKNALLKSVQRGWAENYADLFSFNGSVLKADFLTSADRLYSCPCALGFTYFFSVFSPRTSAAEIPVSNCVLCFTTHTLWFSSTRGMNWNRNTSLALLSCLFSWESIVKIVWFFFYLMYLFVKKGFCPLIRQIFHLLGH